MIGKFMYIGSEHLHWATREALKNNLGPTVAYPHPENCGWFVYVPDDLDVAVEAGAELHIASDLMACMLKARAEGCDYVLFDEGSPTHADLAVYEDPIPA